MVIDIDINIDIVIDIAININIGNLNTDSSTVRFAHACFI